MIAKKGATPINRNSAFKTTLRNDPCYLVQVLHGFGFGQGLHDFGHGKDGASMLVITFAVDCIMLHGCPHVTHGFATGFGHAHGFAHAHGFGHPQSAAITGTANITATAITNTTAAILFIVPSFFMTTIITTLLYTPTNALASV